MVALCCVGGATWAQDTTAQPSLGEAKTVQTEKISTRSVKEVLKRIEEGAGSGTRIVADSTIVNEKVPFPTEPTTPENFEAQIAAVVQSLPSGTAWAKLYLPAAGTRAYKGDDLAEYALAQSRLFGRVGDAPAGSIEVMGKVLSADKAQAVIDTLNLKPVYLLTNTNQSVASNGDSAGWTKMSQEEKDAYAKKQAQKLLDMGPQNLAAQFGQQAAVMGQMFGMMTPEQRDAFRQTMRDTMGNNRNGNMMWGGRGRGGGNGGQRGNQNPNGPVQ